MLNIVLVFAMILALVSSLTKRWQYYTLAVDQGHAQAQFNLGCMYYEGDGIELDKKKALKYYTQSSKQGHAEAQYNLGCLYYGGDGIERDKGEAQKFWELAAAQGHQGAQNNLAILKGANARR